MERIAADSTSEHGAIMEILSAFVRGHAAAAPPVAELGKLAPLHVRADLAGARTDRRTVWPSGFDRRSAGAVLA